MFHTVGMCFIKRCLIIAAENRVLSYTALIIFPTTYKNKMSSCFGEVNGPAQIPQFRIQVVFGQTS